MAKELSLRLKGRIARILAKDEPLPSGITIEDDLKKKLNLPEEEYAELREAIGQYVEDFFESLASGSEPQEELATEPIIEIGQDALGHVLAQNEHPSDILTRIADKNPLLYTYIDRLLEDAKSNREHEGILMGATKVFALFEAQAKINETTKT